MNKKPDNLSRIRSLIRKLNKEHPERFGLVRCDIFDDSSGRFGAGHSITDDYEEFEGFNSLLELKKLFKKYGV